MRGRDSRDKGRLPRVAKTAAATTRGQPAIAIVIQVVQQLTCRSIKDLCSNRNANNQVFAGVARAIRSLTVQTTRRNVAWVVTQVQEGVQRCIRDEDHVAATTTISARWTTAGNKLLAPESRNTVTSVSPVHVNLGAINKHPKIENDARARFIAAQASRTFSETF